MRITLCLSARCTLTYAPSGSPTSSLQGSPHYRQRPAATLRSLTGLPLCWDASFPERRTAQWRARPAERHEDGEGMTSGRDVETRGTNIQGRSARAAIASMHPGHQTTTDPKRVSCMCVALALAAFTGACRRAGRRAAGLPTT